VLPADQLLAESVEEICREAGWPLRLPGFALKMAKHSINYGYDQSLDSATRLEAECCAQCFSTG